MHRLLGWVALVFLASSCLIVDGSFHDKHIDGLWLQVADNPSLRVGYGDEVGRGQKTIALTVPDYFDAGHAALHIDWTGEVLHANGTELTGNTVIVDLGQPLVLAVAGKDREFREYQVETTTVAPSSVKTVSLWAVGRTEWGGPFDTREYYDQYGWVDQWSPSVGAVWEIEPIGTTAPWPLASLELVVEINGYRMLLDGAPYVNDSRRIDFTMAHTLTIVAEDLTTVNYPLKVQNPARISGAVYRSGTLLSYLSGGSESVAVPLGGGSPAGLTLKLIDESCVYPVTLNGTTPVDYDTAVPLDLSTSQTLTVTGPFLSRTYTLTATP